MIKRTLYFGNNAYLSIKDKQLIIDQVIDEEKKTASVPVEDIGVVILDSPQITLTNPVLNGLLKNNASVITCNSKHMPSGLFLNLDGNFVQSEMFRNQIDSSTPLKKQLWAQTVTAKIKNQAGMLKKYGAPINNMMYWAKKVRSGDPNNLEARSANYYWQNLFEYLPEFIRDRDGEAPNNLLNYGYAILRAITARSLVGSGLLPTLGIYHKNKYNAYCLADDIMEPYRAFVDDIVATIVKNGEDFYTLSRSVKTQLMEIGTYTVRINNKKGPLMVQMNRTTSSLAKCFAGKLRKINYPEWNYEF